MNVNANDDSYRKVLAHLEAERDKFTAAITAIQRLIGEPDSEQVVGLATPKPRAVTPPRRAAVKPPRAPIPVAVVVPTATDDLSARILKALAVSGPQSTGQLVATFGSAGKLTAALLALTDSAKVFRIGTGPRNYRWSLEMAPKGLAVTPAAPSTKPPAASLTTAPEDSTRDEAIKAARRFGHTLGPFKPSSVGAGSAHIARCTYCDTYVTIGHKGAISGPGTRHECLAAKGN